MGKLGVRLNAGIPALVGLGLMILAPVGGANTADIRPLTTRSIEVVLGQISLQFERATDHDIRTVQEWPVAAKLTQAQF
jgi:hypothetical protein